MLQAHRRALDAVAQGLLEQETLGAADLARIIEEAAEDQQPARASA